MKNLDTETKEHENTSCIIHIVIIIITSTESHFYFIYYVHSFLWLPTWHLSVQIQLHATILGPKTNFVWPQNKEMQAKIAYILLNLIYSN